MSKKPWKEKRKHMNAQEKQSLKTMTLKSPSLQKSPPVSEQPSRPTAQPTPPVSTQLAVEQSNQFSPVLEAGQIEAAKARIAEAQEVSQKPKRKYTKRGTIPVPQAVSNPSESVPIPISDDEARFFLEMPFNALSKSTKFEGFKLPDDKVTDLTPHMKVIMQKYFPQLQGENAALWALAIGLGLHSASATFGYMSFQKELKLKELESKNGN